MFIDSLSAYHHNCGLPATSLQQLTAWEPKPIPNSNSNDNFAHLMKNEEGLPLIMKAMVHPIPVQIITRMVRKKLAATPACAKDAFFTLLESLGRPRRRFSKVIGVKSKLWADSLTACGADSITVAQFRGQIFKEFEADIPMLYLSDAYSIRHMVDSVLKKYDAA